ncbi:PREDICTED: nucleolar protein 11 [Dufourea novaeangliae]|uniref:Nucleolar protein 11 n=1 Tax=Dufourea novaeangliae TaxID=178035 RepID=A0A154P2Y3_DUFNO|nr:PREDICTED: nucleolar protein 11 [Dufourea novaeangliae]KZC05704.1 Nucleolar protein 11 [Dufourea novaeangliae]
MAKLYSYYTLCPLIDQQNLLGVERDSESGCAIVTLGRNIVIRYKLQDPKQLSSWTSKDRLTTQVIYDETTCRYAAIFNEKKLRLWSENETDLNNIRGYKFQSPLHTILTFETCPPVLVRKDGATASLEWAVQNRKSWSKEGILRAGDKILDCHLICTGIKVSLCLLTKNKGTYTCVVVKLNSETYSQDTDRARRMELKRRSEELVGYTVLCTKKTACLLTLWSHGRLYSHSLMETSNEASLNTLVGIINNIDTKHPVVMTPLNEATVAIYGADASAEGAVLMIYNVQFKLVQDAQKLKLYTKDAKLWKIEDKLLLAANRHLAIAPYHLAPQKIASLLGSSLRFKSNDENEGEDDDIVVIQESKLAQWEGKKPAALKQIPQLIESKDIGTIVWCLNTYKDLPEKLLIDLLIFSLRSPDSTFLPTQNGKINDLPRTNNYYSRNAFLDKIFSLTYSDVSLATYLKSGLNFDEILRLLQYLIQKLDDREQDSPYDDLAQEPAEKQLYEWSSLLLESHYQQYVLSRDPEVSMLLNKLNYVLDDHLRLLKDMENLRPLLNRTINGKSLKLLQKNRNKFYAIEDIKLY